MNRESSADGLLPEILERRSAKSFSADPLPDEAMTLLFEAARWAPSSGNGQPWRFMITRRGSAGHRDLVSTLRESNRWAARAPVLVLAAVRRDHVHPTKPDKPNRLGLLELGLAIGNLLTQAASLGVIAHPIAGFDAGSAGARLGVPETYETAVAIALGWPGRPEEDATSATETRGRSRERIPISDFVFEDRWGRPLEEPAIREEPANQSDDRSPDRSPE